MSLEGRHLFCPGCGTDIPVPRDARPGDLIECESCAGVLFRLVEEGGREALRLVQRVSCPACGERIPVGDDTPEGTILCHGGASFRLRKEFGAFALEPRDGERPLCRAAAPKAGE